MNYAAVGAEVEVMNLMSQRPIGLALATAFITIVGGLLFVPPAPARDQLPPCPPRARGEPHPPNCADPCPTGLVDNGTGCACPPGTVLAERPASPTERCVKRRLPTGILEGPKYKDLIIKPQP
jgi:hypothetical protein